MLLHQKQKDVKHLLRQTSEPMTPPRVLRPTATTKRDKDSEGQELEAQEESEQPQKSKEEFRMGQNLVKMPIFQPKRNLVKVKGTPKQDTKDGGPFSQSTSKKRKKEQKCSRKVSTHGKCM